MLGTIATALAYYLTIASMPEGGEFWFEIITQLIYYS